MSRLRITEIFYSLQGESRSVGFPTVFVRLTGCPLRCGYCDTAYAFQGGQWFELDEIMSQIAELNCQTICVTGGEPLAQKACTELLTLLCDAGYQVSLETSGSIDVAEVDARVSKVMDLKTPSSGEMDKNLYSNIELLTKSDQLKFVISDRDDFNWACEQLLKYDLPSRCEVLFSPVFSELEPTQLADWILAEHLTVRMQVQLHKLLWGDKPGH